MDKKYVILDFGKVLAGPPTGHWFITTKFLELIDMNLVSTEKINLAIKKYGNIISRKITTIDEEYEMFYEFYDFILKEVKYPKYDKDIVHKIAYDFAYYDNKYKYYEGIKEELEYLNSKYKLILLTDNWPSVTRVLDKKDLTKYFEKIYISSCYGVLKKDGLFFDYPINDFNIKKGEAIFIDDDELNISVGSRKGLEVLLMDRENEIKNSNYQIINNLYDIEF